jgi:hypothetical protein
MEQQTVISRTRDWLAAILIGLDLCRFRPARVSGRRSTVRRKTAGA